MKIVKHSHMRDGEIQVRLGVLAGEMRVAHRATKHICASSPLRSTPVGAKQSSPGRLAPD